MPSSPDGLPAIQKPTVSFIGTGACGQTLARLMSLNQSGVIQGIFNRNPDHSATAIAFIGAGTAYPDSLSLPKSDIIFITTPDDAISEASLTLALNKNIQPGTLIVHCSGALTSDSLFPLKQRGCFIASVHPMRSFSDPLMSVQDYAGTFCSMEGDSEAIESLSALFQSFGSVTYAIQRDQKIKVHIAGVLASNYLVTLSHQALLCLQEAGVDKEMAMDMVINLMKGTVSNLEKTKSPEQALTGPIQRGDLTTLSNHLDAARSPVQKELYARLGQATVHLTNHSDGIKAELNRLFS